MNLYSKVARNEYSVAENLFNIFDEPTTEGTFYNIRGFFKDDMMPTIWEGNESTLLWHTLLLDSVEIHHEKTVYGILDLIGDLGGVADIFFFGIGLIILPFSSYGYYLKTLGLLYFAKVDSGCNLFTG